MPTVPYLSQPRVAPNALPGPNISPNVPQGAFRGAAQNLPDLSGVTKVAEGEMEARHKIALEEAYQADQVAVTHAVSHTQNDVNDWMNGPDGLLRRKGKNAFTIDQEAYDRYGALVSDVRSQLGNDRQRAVYDKYVMNGWDSIQSQVVPHIAQQREAFDKEGVDSLITAQSNALLAAPLNPVVVEHAIQASQAARTAWLERQGADDDTIKNARDDIASGARMDVIKSMLNSTIPNRDQMAASYYEKYKSQLVGKDALDAERLTKTSLLEGDALRTADKILATTASETAAYAETDKQIDDPVLREKANQHISAVYNRKQGAIQADQKAAYESGATTLHSHGGDITAISSVQRQAMGEAHYQNLENEAWRLTHTRDAGDPEQYNQLVNMANFQKDAFNKIDITSIQGLSQQQIHTLQTIQRGSINSDVRQSESDLQRDLTRSQANERRYRNAAERATDPEEKAAFEAQQVEANTQSTLIQADLIKLKQSARGTPIQTPLPPASPPATSSTPSAPLTVPTPRTPPVALTPLKTPPPSIAIEIGKAKALGLTDYLTLARQHGWDVDGVPAAVPAPPAGPVVNEVTVHRDPKTDKVTKVTKKTSTPQ